MKPDVTIVSIADVPLHIPSGIGREGSSASKPFPLDSGVPGVRLEFTWRRYDKGYATPRHKHSRGSAEDLDVETSVGGAVG